MSDIRKIADEADMIVNGYAFKKSPEGYKVLNLNKPICAVVINTAGEVLETTMDDIELQIVREYYEKNRRFMEE